MEKKYTNIKERLLYFAKNQSVGIENFLTKIGMTYGSFKGKAKEGSLNSNALVEIYTNYPELNIEWLLTGNGSMLKKNNEVKESKTEPTNIDYKELAEARHETIQSLKRENSMQHKEIARLEKEIVEVKKTYTKKSTSEVDLEHAAQPKS